LSRRAPRSCRARLGFLAINRITAELWCMGRNHHAASAAWLRPAGQSPKVPSCQDRVFRSLAGGCGGSCTGPLRAASYGRSAGDITAHLRCIPPCAAVQSGGDRGPGACALETETTPDSPRPGLLLFLSSPRRGGPWAAGALLCRRPFFSRPAPTNSWPCTH
jgi:hypothetical protein